MPGALAFATAELTAMRAAQTAHMMDRCTIGVRTAGSANGYGNVAVTFVSSAALDCGFWVMGADEVMDSSDVPQFDARLRLPIGTAVGYADRVTITHRHGTALSPAETFEVIGQPERGPSGLVLKLRRV